MNVYATGGDERGLCDQQKNPAGEHRAVYMNESVGQRRPKESGKIVGVRKADEDRQQHDQRHAGKEDVIETASGEVRSASARLGVFRSCGHRAPAMQWSLNFLVEHPEAVPASLALVFGGFAF